MKLAAPLQMMNHLMFYCNGKLCQPTDCHQASRVIKTDALEICMALDCVHVSLAGKTECNIE